MKIHRDLISKVVKTWLQLLYKTFKEFEEHMFLKKNEISRPLPRHFRNKILKNVTTVIDCTELKVESSENYRQQGHLWSSYKHHTTAKVLIGVAPSGACTFVSSCFEGSISDVEIVQRSGFLEKIDSTPTILANRGFTIERELATKNAKLIIPPFLKRKHHFTLKETRDTKIIARARIHIERQKIVSIFGLFWMPLIPFYKHFTHALRAMIKAMIATIICLNRFNKRLKEFRFLSNVISQKDLPMLTQAVFVCSCLTNFISLLAK